MINISFPALYKVTDSKIKCRDGEVVLEAWEECRLELKRGIDNTLSYERNEKYWDSRYVENRAR